MSLPSNEQWRPVPGYEGLYEVSSHGRVRSWVPWAGRPTPRTLACPPNVRDGYPAVGLIREGRRTTHKVHNLVARAFIGPRAPGEVVRHLDGDRTHNRPANLAYGSIADNAQDAIAHGTNARNNLTHCHEGHEYTPENTYRSPRGHRRCRICKRANMAKFREQRRRRAS